MTSASDRLIAGNDNIIRCRANPVPNSLTWTAIQIGIRLVRMGFATGKSLAQHLHGSRLRQEHPRAAASVCRAYPCHLRTSCLRVEDHSTTTEFLGVGQSFSDLRKASANGCCH